MDNKYVIKLKNIINNNFVNESFLKNNKGIIAIK
jgi:hypothetical protein